MKTNKEILYKQFQDAVNEARHAKEVARIYALAYERKQKLAGDLLEKLSALID